MGLAEAKKYITDLHKRQKDPYLWPDFLTGLPDKAAILKRLGETAPKSGNSSAAYVRIANIQSYLIKYGPNRHAEIIQWAAALLKTSVEAHKNGFVGTLNTHDFMVVCDCREMPLIINEASQLFSRRMAGFYNDADRKKNETLSFRKSDGNAVSIGLMKLVSVIADRKLPVLKGDLVLAMARTCDAMEGTADDLVMMTADMVHRD